MNVTTCGEVGVAPPRERRDCPIVTVYVVLGASVLSGWKTNDVDASPYERLPGTGGAMANEEGIVFGSSTALKPKYNVGVRETPILPFIGLEMTR